MSATTQGRDWRASYIICEHLRANANLRPKAASQSAGRACCHPCVSKGFLHLVLEVSKDADGFEVGRISELQP